MSTSKKLAELAEIMRKAPKGSTKYKKAMKEIDHILGMNQEPEREGHERYDEDDVSDADAD